MDGVKEGKGYYKGTNGVKYRGDYKGGKKEGFGIIYNSDDTISYKGEMKGDLPNGKGTAFFDNMVVSSEWV